MVTLIDDEKLDAAPRLGVELHLVQKARNDLRQGDVVPSSAPAVGGGQLHPGVDQPVEAEQRIGFILRETVTLRIPDGEVPEVRGFERDLLLPSELHERIDGQMGNPPRPQVDRQLLRVRLVQMRPPMRSYASITIERIPACRSAHAVVTPAMPAPTMRTPRPGMKKASSHLSLSGGIIRSGGRGADGLGRLFGGSRGSLTACIAVVVPLADGAAMRVLVCCRLPRQRTHAAQVTHTERRLS
jgi:hypothetical protein